MKILSQSVFNLLCDDYWDYKKLRVVSQKGVLAAVFALLSVYFQGEFVTDKHCQYSELQSKMVAV